MENVNIPFDPNPFIVEWLVSPRCRSIVFEAAELYQALYREIVSKRTGALARSARVSTGLEVDRWVGHMEVGSATAFYGASHEFGTDDGDEHITAGHHDLNTILDAMGTL